MKQIYSDLWQTLAEHPYHGVTTHAYLLVQDAGNILFYSSGLSEEHQHIRELGGITHQYLSHRDEAGPALADIKRLFGSKLCCHRFEEAAVKKFTPVDCRFEERRGTKLRYAPMSRDLRTRLGLSIAAVKASAVSWPTPGMVI